MEFKHFAIEELKADDETRTVEGYASVFNNVDAGNDIVLPGAFLKSLKKRPKVKMLWQHKQDEPIGLWTELEERDRGLYVKGVLADTPEGNKAYKLLLMGAIDGLSIGYSTKKYEIDSVKGVRKLIELDLMETSIVTFPMNERANVTRVKSAHDNERDFEDFLREAGYSRDAAKIICARGFKALGGQREAEAQGIAELSNLFKQFKV